MSISSQVCTVGLVAQTNRDAHFLRDYLPEKYRKPDGAIIPAADLKREENIRIGLFVARQLAGAPALVMATPIYIWSGAGGFIVGTVGGICKEMKWFAPGSLKKQWKDWMSCTIILDSKTKKIEKAVEGTIVVANFALSWLTSVPSGILFGGTWGWTAGRWLVHQFHPREEDREPMFGDQSRIFMSLGDEDGSHRQPSGMVHEV